VLLSELSHEFFSAFENAHATEHKRLHMLWQVFRRKKLRKRAKIATLVPAEVVYLYLGDLRGAAVPDAVARFASKLSP
jgi:hypothetical protein